MIGACNLIPRTANWEGIKFHFSFVSVFVVDYLPRKYSKKFVQKKQTLLDQHEILNNK